MAITLRSSKGSPLTHTEMDNNFTELRDAIVDSANIQQLIDSSYVKTFIDSAYVHNLVDSSYITTFIDSAYVHNLVDSSYITTFIDSAHVHNLVDSAYVESLGLTDSAAQIPFVPGDSSDWVTQPTTVEDALNRMASLLQVLNSGPIP